MLERGDHNPKMTWEWGGKRYALPLTSDDILKLGRAVDEEGYPREGVAWTLIQRTAFLNTQGTPISLGRLVELYAQPINPGWFPTGDKHIAWVKYLEENGRKAEAEQEKARASRRPAKASKPWEALKPETRAVIGAILANRLKTPVVGAVHYWASRAKSEQGAFNVNQAKKPDLILLDRGYGFGPGRNVFFAEKGNSRFGGAMKFENAVGLMPGGGSIPPSPQLAGMITPGALVVGGILGALAWKWFR